MNLSTTALTTLIHWVPFIDHNFGLLLLYLAFSLTGTRLKAAGPGLCPCFPAELLLPASSRSRLCRFLSASLIPEHTLPSHFAKTTMFSTVTWCNDHIWERTNPPGELCYPASQEPTSGYTAKGPDACRCI